MNISEKIALMERHFRAIVGWLGKAVPEDNMWPEGRTLWTMVGDDYRVNTRFGLMSRGNGHPPQFFLARNLDRRWSETAQGGLYAELKSGRIWALKFGEGPDRSGCPQKEQEPDWSSWYRVVECMVRDWKAIRDSILEQLEEAERIRNFTPGSIGA